MFIVCPKCSAKYKIPEGIQLESGQKLKCSACDFVFLKGEESPFTLNDSMISTPDAEQKTTDKVPFSEPLYTAQDLKTSPADSLPEAFQPVAEPPKKKGLGLIFLYIVLVIILCIVGWNYRDTLKPSFQNSISSLALDESKIPPKIRQNALPVRPKRMIPANQPVVQVSDLDKVESDKQPLPPPQLQPINPVKQMPKQPKILPPKNSLPPPPNRNISPQPVQNSGNKFGQAGAVIPPPAEVVPPVPAPVSEPAVIPLSEPGVIPLPESTIIPASESDTIPLFEVLDTPVPAGTTAELVVRDITFRVEPTEDGLGQVLIEGQVQNKTSDIRSVPVLTVQAVNKDGQVLVQKKVHTATDSLHGGEQVPFYTSLSPAPDTIDHIEVQF